MTTIQIRVLHGRRGEDVTHHVFYAYDKAREHIDNLKADPSVDMIQVSTRPIGQWQTELVRDDDGREAGRLRELLARRLEADRLRIPKAESFGRRLLADLTGIWPADSTPETSTLDAPETSTEEAA
jgi:hypothetical protein